MVVWMGKTGRAPPSKAAGARPCEIHCLGGWGGGNVRICGLLRLCLFLMYAQHDVGRCDARSFVAGIWLGEDMFCTVCTETARVSFSVLTN